jgi:branched-chain amino acid transport system substrate-binding protein
MGEAMRPLAVAIILLSAVLGNSARAEIVIGAAGPITGKLTWIGEQLQRGTEMSVADINAAGGVLGQQVRLVTADDFCDPVQAVAAARKLVRDGAVAVIGHYCSGASIPASEIYEKAHVIQISPGSTNPLLTEQGRLNVFRVIGRDDVQGRVAGRYLADHWGDKKIAILHDFTTYGKGLADETKKELNKRGIIEEIYTSYTPGKIEYSTEIAALQAAHVAVIYIGGYHTEVALMARAARDRGFTVQLVSGDAMATEELALIAGAAADGLLFTFVADPRRNPEAASVVERFRADNFEPLSYTLLTYGAVQVWAQAVEKAGSVNPQLAIASMRSNRFETVLGPIEFDDKGDLTAQNWVWYIWRGGEYVPLK